MKEKWRDIPGYEKLYQASTRGRIKSLGRWIIRGDNIQQWVNERILSNKKPKVSKYVIVTLGRDVTGIVRPSQSVHRLVALTWIPNPKNLPEVNHKNLDKLDNRVSNLEWTTPSGNGKHAVKNGVLYNPRPKRGEQAGASKLTWDRVRRIRQVVSASLFTRREMAELYGVTRINIGYIMTNKTWKEEYQNQEGLTLPSVTKKED